MVRDCSKRRRTLGPEGGATDVGSASGACAQVPWFLGEVWGPRRRPARLWVRRQASRRAWYVSDQNVTSRRAVRIRPKRDDVATNSCVTRDRRSPPGTGRLEPVTNRGMSPVGYPRRGLRFTTVVSPRVAARYVSDQNVTMSLRIPVLPVTADRPRVRDVSNR